CEQGLEGSARAPPDREPLFRGARALQDYRLPREPLRHRRAPVGEDRPVGEVLDGHARTRVRTAEMFRRRMLRTTCSPAAPLMALAISSSPTARTFLIGVAA